MLVSAPAGFGKTTRVSHRVRAQALPAAWLAPAAADNDPVRFLRHDESAIIVFGSRIA